MAHLCVPQNQALGVCRGFVPDIQVCGTHGREDLVKATITSNAEEEEVHLKRDRTGFDPVCPMKPYAELICMCFPQTF